MMREGKQFGQLLKGKKEVRSEVHGKVFSAFDPRGGGQVRGRQVKISPGDGRS